MTDLERLRELLESFGVEFTENDTLCEKEIVCEQGRAKVQGYIGFCTIFQFYPDGKFRDMGAYE